jgi:hypothetical protein
LPERQNFKWDKRLSQKPKIFNHKGHKCFSQSIKNQYFIFVPTSSTSVNRFVRSLCSLWLKKTFETTSVLDIIHRKLRLCLVCGYENQTFQVVCVNY